MQFLSGKCSLGMIISNKCYYGLKAMIELALREGQGPITIGEIARAQGIPVRFLEAILRQLKQAGYADSIRGKEGGYVIAKEPAFVRLGDLILFFEGPLMAVSPSATAHESASPTPIPDVLSPIWKRAEKSLLDVLSSYSLQDLVEMERARNSSEAMNYTI